TRLLYSPFLFTATAPTAISTLSLHDALPIFALGVASQLGITLDLVLLGGHQQQVHLARFGSLTQHLVVDRHVFDVKRDVLFCLRSEEHTSELQSRENLVCRLLLEKKKKKIN